MEAALQDSRRSRGGQRSRHARYGPDRGGVRAHAEIRALPGWAWTASAGADIPLNRGTADVEQVPGSAVEAGVGRGARQEVQSCLVGHRIAGPQFF